MEEMIKEKQEKLDQLNALWALIEEVEDSFWCHIKKDYQLTLGGTLAGVWEFVELADKMLELPCNLVGEEDQEEIKAIAQEVKAATGSAIENLKTACCRFSKIKLPIAIKRDQVSADLALAKIEHWKKNKRD